MTTKLTINVPTDLHRKLKVTAAERGSTMTELLLDCAQKIVTEQQPDRTSEDRAAYRTKEG